MDAEQFVSDGMARVSAVCLAYLARSGHAFGSPEFGAEMQVEGLVKAVCGELLAHIASGLPTGEPVVAVSETASEVTDPTDPSEAVGLPG